MCKLWTQCHLEIMCGCDHEPELLQALKSKLLLWPKKKMEGGSQSHQLKAFMQELVIALAFGKVISSVR